MADRSQDPVVDRAARLRSFYGQVQSPPERTLKRYPARTILGQIFCLRRVIWALAVCSAASAAGLRVSAPFAASAAGASVLPAALSRHSRSFALAVGVPVPASAGVSDGPLPASGIACSAVAGISGPV